MKANNENSYDLIVVGSGACGATIAREVSATGKRVLVLERGKSTNMRETAFSMISVMDEVSLGKGLSTARALTTGGSTSLYFGVANYPNLDTYRDLGIDLDKSFDWACDQLPLAPLPDSIIGNQTIRLRDSAQSLGYDWLKNDMMVDQSLLSSNYSYEAKWKAKSYMDDALQNGCTLVNQALVFEVIKDRNRAVGVKYLDKSNRGSKSVEVFASKIVIAAGELATPLLLRRAGIQDVAKHGFFCDPGYAIYGLVPNLEATDTFVGSMSCVIEDDIELGDANVPRALHRLMMLSKFKLRHWWKYSQSIGIGVKVKDEICGSMGDDGTLSKKVSSKELEKLAKGEKVAIKILENAGAKHVFNFGLSSAGHVGGMVEIGTHVNSNLETTLENMYVCDGSILPESERITPTVSLVSLAKYLSDKLNDCL